MKKTGIWLDKKKAIIVTLENEVETLRIVDSGIDDYHVTSYKSGGGALEVSKDMKFMEREKHQFKAYFKDVIDGVKDSDSLVIFGPAGTCEKLSKELEAHHADLSRRVKAVKKADSMTNNQVKAWVRDFYKATKRILP